MRTLLRCLGIGFLASLLVSGPAWALTRRWVLTQNLTGTAPSASTCANGSISTACGLSLANAKGWRACVRANAAQTLTNVTLDLYTYDYTDNDWGKQPSLQVTATAVGTRKMCTASSPVSHQNARMYAVPNGVTVSGGTTVEVSIEVTY